MAKVDTRTLTPDILEAVRRRAVDLVTGGMTSVVCQKFR
jgi:hypothetical protein